MEKDRRSTDTPRPVEAVLTELDGLLDELAAAASSPELDATRLTAASARLRVAGTRLDAVRWAVLPRIQSAGLWAQTGARTFAVWLARTEDVQTLTARRDARTATALRDHLPATLSAALAGEISTDKVRALVDVATTSPARLNALAGPAVEVPTVEPAGDEPAGDEVAGDPVAGGEPAGDEPATGEPAEAVAPTAPAPTAPSSAPTWEEQLLDWSAENGPDRFRGLVRYFARHADPDSDERGYTTAKQREHLDVSPTLGGYHLSGFLTEEHGQTLTAAIGSVLGAPAAGDDRTAGQRRAQALADLARTVLDNGRTGTGASVRPHLSVTVSWSELQELAAKNDAKEPAGTILRTRLTPTPTSWDQPEQTQPELSVLPIQPTPPTLPVLPSGFARPAVFTETSTPVPRSLLRRIACDSEITRIVFGPDSQVLDVGRSRRTVTGQLRRAVIARDQHCVYDQCDQPPSRCEVHHALRHWADGGETSVTNAALLCWHHHDLVDSRNLTMRYDNGWRFGEPDSRSFRAA